MDPKQTEGQNSSGPAMPQGGFTFSSGQVATPSGSTGVAASSTLSTGANISRTMDDLNVNDRKSATSNSPFAKHHFNKVAPQTGDIIIGQSKGSIISSGPSEPKINRGRLIQFGLIFGGIALVGLVVFTIIMLVNKPKTTTTKPSTADINYQDAFNRYANWMIIGEDSSEEIIVPKDTSAYYVRKVINSSDDKVDYIKTANSYYNDFYNAFNSSSLTSYVSLASTVSSSYENLKFYASYLEQANYSEQDFLELYLESPDTFTVGLNEIYDALASDNSVATSFSERGKARVAILAQWFQLLSQNNCIKNNTINESCSNTLISSDQNAKQLSDDNTQQKQMMDAELSTSINKVIYYIYNIYTELQSPTETEEYSESADETTVRQEMEGK